MMDRLPECGSTFLQQELESLNVGKTWLCDLYVKQKGRLDALAVWFDLHLDDTVTISTAANNKTCWEQAIYPITSITKRIPEGIIPVFFLLTHKVFHCLLVLAWHS